MPTLATPMTTPKPTMTVRTRKAMMLMPALKLKSSQTPIIAQTSTQTIALKHKWQTMMKLVKRTQSVRSPCTNTSRKSQG